MVANHRKQIVHEPLVVCFTGIFQYFQTGATYVAALFTSVILLGILWKRTYYKGQSLASSAVW